MSPKFVNSTCNPVLCPDNSIGVNVISGCTCKGGRTGSIVPSTVGPNYFTSSCSIDYPRFLVVGGGGGGGNRHGGGGGK